MKVLNLSKIWVRSEQDVDDLIYESIKSESDLSQIWVRSEQDVDNLIYESIKFKQDLTF